jgi:tripartite-type tricarboxylate transporter receptor subunit TctC
MVPRPSRPLLAALFAGSAMVPNAQVCRQLRIVRFFEVGNMRRYAARLAMQEIHMTMEKLPARAIRAAAAILTVGLLLQDHASAQSYPNRAIRFIANGNPGGVIDTIARVTANTLTPLVGVQVIVENKPGASSIIGTQFVVNSAPDGYTLLFTGVDGMGILPAPVKQLPYDPEKDLIPIAKVTQVDVVLAVGGHVPAGSVREFVDLAKSRPGKLTFASTGLGTMTHMAGEFLKLRAGIDILHVPYRGSAPAVTDLLGGRVDLVFTGVATAAGHVASGSVKIIASAGKHRPSTMPNVPTMIESGYPDFLAGSWFGVMAPAGTPSDVVRILSQKLSEVASSQQFLEQLAKLGSEKSLELTDEFSKSLNAERKLWSSIAKEANIKLGE